LQHIGEKSDLKEGGGIGKKAHGKLMKGAKMRMRDSYLERSVRKERFNFESIVVILSIFLREALSGEKSGRLTCTLGN
jgi:hypothetical protein